MFNFEEYKDEVVEKIEELNESVKSLKNDDEPFLPLEIEELDVQEEEKEEEEELQELQELDVQMFSNDGISADEYFEIMMEHTNYLFLNGQITYDSVSTLQSSYGLHLSNKEQSKIVAESGWMISITIVLALGLKFFSDQITKW